MSTVALYCCWWIRLLHLLLCVPKIVLYFLNRKGWKNVLAPISLTLIFPCQWKVWKHRCTINNVVSRQLNTLSVQHVRNTFLILSCTPFCPQNSPNSSGHGLHRVPSIPQGCWPMLTPMLPTVVSSWLDVIWVVDHSWHTGETVECEKPNSVAVPHVSYAQCIFPWQWYMLLFMFT